MKESMRPGLRGSLSVDIDDSLTVPAVSDRYPRFDTMPPVFATGYLVAFAECAAMEVMAEHLDEGEDSVGIEVNFTHTAPTPVGFTVTAEAELTEVDERVLSFEISLCDDAGPIGSGTHRRAVINRAKFGAGVEQRRNL